jgi:hypothetical protein
MTEYVEVREVSDLIRTDGYVCFTRCPQATAFFILLQEHQNHILHRDARVDLYFNRYPANVENIVSS